MVAIKVAVDEAPTPAKRRRSIAKKLDAKPTCPKEEIVEDLYTYRSYKSRR